MDRSEIIASFSDPSSAGVVPVPVANASPARRLRDSLEPIAMHSVWSQATHDRLGPLGLDFMQSYVLSRASLLGRPSPGVVAAAFAVFEPTMISAIYEGSRDLVDRDTLLAARSESTAAGLRDLLDDADLAPVAEALRRAVQDADGTGRPLFSGLAAQPWPTDPAETLWRACEQIREHRGDSHVAVCVAHGLGPVEMNVLTELWLGMPLGSYTASRGWPEQAIAAARERLGDAGWLDEDGLTEAGLRFRDGIEAETDALEQPIVDALGADFETVVIRLDEWSRRCVSAGQFPDNAFKRAAG